MARYLLLSCCAVLLLTGWAVTPAAADSIDDRVDRLNELLKDFPHVVVERRADEVVATGWARDSKEKKRIDEVLSTDKEIIDLIGEDLAGGDRMVEIDVTIVAVTDTVSKTVGFDFLSLINYTFERGTERSFAWKQDSSEPYPWIPNTSSSKRTRTSSHEAKVDYNINIANALDKFVHIVARPHLTTLNGQKAEFLAGGEIVFKVSGLSGGRIQPYPYGINLKVTPTVLNTPGDNGETQVLLDIEASRLSVLEFQLTTDDEGSSGLDNVSFDKIEVKSKALLPMDETLILGGLYQSETRNLRSGVPVLRDIPFIKYFFSTKSNVTEVLSMVIMLTPREHTVLNDETQNHLDWFIQRRAAYLDAGERGGEAIERFKKQYPNWYKPQWNHYATHFFLYNNSAAYRGLRGEDLRTDTIRRDIMSVETAKEIAKQVGKRH